MFAERGLHRSVDVADKAGTTRLRWQAERPGALWHGDVCHGPTVTIGTRRTPVCEGDGVPCLEQFDAFYGCREGG
jgi:hypothetical protein